MSKQHSKEKGRAEGAKEGGHAVQGARRAAPDDSQWAKQLRVIYQLCKSKPEATNLVRLKELDPGDSDGDSRSTLFMLCAARLKLHAAQHSGLERLRAMEELAPSLSRKARAATAAKPYCMGLIKLCAECLECTPHAPAAVSAFLLEWFEGPLSSLNADEWVDPSDEACDDEPSGSKKDRLAMRRQELERMRDAAVRKLERLMYTEKAAVGISKDIMAIAESRQMAEMDRQEDNAKGQELEDKDRKNKEEVLQFLTAKLKSLPEGSKERITALLELTEISPTQLSTYMTENFKAQGPGDKEGKDKGKTKSADTQAKLLRLLQQARERGDWCYWSATPPSQVRLDDDGDDGGAAAATEEPGDKPGKGGAGGAGKGGKGKGGKGASAGGGKGASGKGGEAGKQAQAEGGDAEDTPRRLTSVASWLKLLEKDLEGYTYSTNLTLPYSEAPTVAELWNNAATLLQDDDALLGDKAAEEHGDSPAEILLRYHRSLNDASVSLFANMVAREDSAYGNYAIETCMEGVTEEQRQWQGYRDLAHGFGLLLRLRGLAAPLDAMDLCQGPDSLWADYSASMEQFYAYWHHEDHQLAVSAIEGSLLPDDMFAMPGSRGLLRCTDDIQEALTHLCKRRAEAVKQASAAVASSDGELLRGLDGVPEGKALTLLVQLRMDVLEAVRLLWESKAMMPMLRRTLERYLAACAQQRGRGTTAALNALDDDKALTQALADLPYVQLQPLRTFLLTEVGRRRVYLQPVIEAEAALVAFQTKALGPDLKAPLPRSGAVPLRMSRDTLAFAVRIASQMAYRQQVQQALLEYQELSADSTVLPCARWPAPPQLPQLGTPQAEALLIDYLWNPPRAALCLDLFTQFAFDDLARQLDLAAAVCGRARHVWRERCGIMQHIGDHDIEGLDHDALLELRRRTLSLRKVVAESWHSLYKARYDEFSTQAQPATKSLKDVTNRLAEATRPRPKVKEGAAGKKGAQVQAEKKDEQRDAQISALEQDRAHLAAEVADLNRVEASCQSRMQEMEKEVRNVEQQLKSLEHSNLTALAAGCRKDLDRAAMFVREWAMLCEACMGNARYIAGCMAVYPPYFGCNNYEDMYVALWRTVLVERKTEEITMHLITADEEAAKAKAKEDKAKEDKKKKEASKAAAKKAKQQVAVVKAPSEDEEEEEEAKSEAEAVAADKELKIRVDGQELQEAAAAGEEVEEQEAVWADAVQQQQQAEEKEETEFDVEVRVTQGFMREHGITDELCDPDLLAKLSERIQAELRRLAQRKERQQAGATLQAQAAGQVEAAAGQAEQSQGRGKQPPPQQQQQGVKAGAGVGATGRQPQGNGTAATADASREAAPGAAPGAFSSQGRRPRDREPMAAPAPAAPKDSKDHVMARRVGDKLVLPGEAAGGRPEGAAAGGRQAAGGQAGPPGARSVPGQASGSEDESTVAPGRAKRGKKKGGRGGEAVAPGPGLVQGVGGAGQQPPAAGGVKNVVPGMEFVEGEQPGAKGKGRARARGGRGRQGGEPDSALRQDQTAGQEGMYGEVWQPEAYGSDVGWAEPQGDAMQAGARSAVAMSAHTGSWRGARGGDSYPPQHQLPDIGPPALPGADDDDDSDLALLGVAPPPTAHPGQGFGDYGAGGYSAPPGDQWQQQHPQQPDAGADAWAQGGQGWPREGWSQGQGQGQEGWGQGGDAWHSQGRSQEGWALGPPALPGGEHGDFGAAHEGYDQHGKQMEGRRSGLRHGPLPTVPDPNLAQYTAAFGPGGAPPPSMQFRQQGGPFFQGQGLGPTDHGVGPGPEHGYGLDAGVEAGPGRGVGPGPGTGLPGYPGALGGRGLGADASLYHSAGQQGYGGKLGMGGQGPYPEEQQQQPYLQGHMDGEQHQGQYQQQQQQRQQGPQGMTAMSRPGMHGLPAAQPLHAAPGAGPGPMPPGARPAMQLPLHLQAALPANPQALPMQIRPPPLAAGVRPSLVTPQFPGGLPMPPMLPGGLPPQLAIGPGGALQPPLGALPAAGPGALGMPALQQQQQDASGMEAGSDSGDDADDLMALCGVSAVPAVARPVPAAQAQLGMQLAPLLSTSPMTAPGMLPHGTPWPGGMHAAQQQQQQQLHQQQQAISTGGASSSATAAAAPGATPWTARPEAIAATTMAMMNDPGAAGFVGVVDDQEYPTLGAVPAGRQGGAGARSSWANVAKVQAQAPRPDEDDEDEAYQRALEESRRTASQASDVTSYAGAGRAAAASGASVWSGPGAVQDTAASQLSGTGLVNRQGEYNCFLNVIIQCLWHCDAFRRIIEMHPPEVFQGQPVVHSLALLFRALSEAERRFASGGHRSTVDPTQLREALDTLPNHNFRLGEMNDPSEVLTAIYECLTRSPQLRTERNICLVDRVFGLQLSEQLQCRFCHKVSHVIKPHVEYFHIVQATALRNMAIAAPGSMSRMLQELESQNQKKCDTDLQGCDKPGTPLRKLENEPLMFTLLIAWEEQVSAEEVRTTLEAVDTEVWVVGKELTTSLLPPLCVYNAQLSLAEVYDECRAARAYRLHSMFCYYGQHYHAFIHKEELQQWVMFDDAHVASIGGGWPDVVNKCTAGRIQPLVLFYRLVQ